MPGLPFYALSLLMAEHIWLKSLCFRFCCFSLCCFSVFCGSAIFSLSASASDLRISRPEPVELPSSCCDKEVNQDIQQQIVCPGSVLAHFNHWRKNYVEPVLCPVFLCHGSCGQFDDACILQQGVVLNRSKGCGGSCQ
ncbi:hypothetical protein BH11CYA1_BH11CYA1_28550 [soil metagenome]